MKSINGIIESEKSCVALGFFDGVHVAHQAVINSAFEGCGEKIVLSIGDKGKTASGALLTARETERQLAALGAEIYLTPDFDTIKDMTGEQFVAGILHEKLCAVRVACGFNYRFGKGASCGADELRELCGKYGIECSIVQSVEQDGEPVSSTAIRAALMQGDITRANRLLGRRYGYTLPVVDGQHLGRRLGTPTINQGIPQGLITPKFGVYASISRAGGVWYSSVTNIGVRPTVGSDAPLSETWLSGFSGDLYGQQVRVELVDFIRPEQKFDSLDSLREQISRDGKRALECTEKLVTALNQSKTGKLQQNPQK